MLKRLIKRRLVLAVVALLLLAGMLAAPIRREYSIDDHPCSTADCNVQILTTDAHYGVPFAWLTLSKSVYQPSLKAASATSVRNMEKLALDLGAWAAVAIVVVLSMKYLGSIRQYANSRH